MLNKVSWANVSKSISSNISGLKLTGGTPSPFIIQFEFTRRLLDLRFQEFDNIKINLSKLLIIQNKKEFKINNTEKIILEKMINAPGQTFSRESIGKLIDLDKERSIDVIITRLRKKIEIDPKNPKYLQTIRGTGYVLWIE